MPPRTAEAFVLDAVPWRERDKLVTLFTESDGKIRGLAHGAARSVKRFGGRLERLNRVRVGYFEKEGQEIVRLDDVELIEAAFALQKEIVVAASLAYVSEIAGEFVREKEPDRRYYRLIGATLDAFRGGATAAVVLRYFEYWTARLHGIFPDLDACDRCGADLSGQGARVSVTEGAAMCPGCARGAPERTLPLSVAALSVAAAFRRAKPAALPDAVFPRRALDEIAAATNSALVSFVGHPFRSSAFLDQVLMERTR
ncbi:MAG: DNA repair protein RecO [Acidobacteria bacterium]|nr:DNA repair protein RecO [Acidobacteriota bacterium]